MRATDAPASVVDEAPRFAFPKPPLGRARGAVELGSSLVIEHPMLKQACSIPWDQVASVVRVRERSTAPPLLRRDVRRLDFTARALDANVVFVLRAPCHVAEFSYGADMAFGITRRERRRGLDVDVIGVTVVDPDGLLAAVAALGVEPLGSLDRAMKHSIGEPTGVELAERSSRVRRSQWIQFASCIGAGLGMILLMDARTLLARPAGSVTMSEALTLLAVSLGVGCVSALCVASVTARRRRTRPLRERVSPWKTAGVAVAILLAVSFPFVARGIRDSGGLDIPWLPFLGVLAGVLGGGIAGLAPRFAPVRDGLP